MRGGSHEEVCKNPLDMDNMLIHPSKALCIRALMTVIALFALPSTQLHAQQLAKMPFMADCVLMQNKATALFAKGLPPADWPAIATAMEEDMKPYRSGQGHAPHLLKAEIQQLLTFDEKPDLPLQTREANQKALASTDTALCWQDYAAKRDHTFPSAERAQFLADLRAQEAQKLAEAARLEASKPDDGKTIGRGARGHP